MDYPKDKEKNMRKYESASHFYNVSNKIAKSKGYDLSDYKIQLLELYNSNKNINLDRFTYDLRFLSDNEDQFKIVLSNYYPTTKQSKRIYNNDSNPFKDSLGFLSGKSGIYKLYNDSLELVYIGKSKNFINRLPSSLRERKVTKFSYAIIDNLADMNVYEMYYIGKYKPIFNSESNSSDVLTVTLPEHQFSDILDIDEMIESCKAVR